jgi:pantoate--beta-alanine ligase
VTVGLVPTMGALHAGHRALLRRARGECDEVVMSLFVNPAQFGPGEDFGRYPRDEARDRAVAAEEGVDRVFAPTVGEMYPDGFSTTVSVGALGAVFEGVHRPGHFDGVATVVLKLFAVVRPDVAYFGQKDAQQVAVLRRMVRDLNVPLELRMLPTVRDEDGLALSSRNAYLSPAERRQALALPRALDAARTAADPVAAARAALNGLQAEYVELLRVGDATLLTAAALIGTTRLIDNVILEIPCQASAWVGPPKEEES